MKKNSIWARLYMFLVFFFLFAPIVVMILFSFNADIQDAAVRNRSGQEIWFLQFWNGFMLTVGSSKTEL